MLKISRNNFTLIILVFFILSASLLGTGQIENEGHVLKNYVLPSIINNINIIIYFLLIGFFCGLGLIRFTKDFRIFKPMLMLIFSYFILFFWAIVNSSDYLRYFILLFSILLCPIGILYAIERVNFHNLSRVVVFISSILIILSVIYSYLNLPDLSRISGIHNNPNLMGAWLISLLTVILYFSKGINKNIIYIIVTIVMLLVLLSGSRLAFIVLFILLIPFIFKYKFFSILAFIFIFFYLLLSGDETTFRAVEVGSAVSDSGRESIWERTIECIYLEPLVGHGMFGAENCVNRPNIHNSYLRLALMLGIPLTIVFFLSFFTFLVKSIFLQVNSYIKLYLIGIPLMFFAEDYVSGFASPFFPFLVFILALFLFDLKKSRILEK